MKFEINPYNQLNKLHASKQLFKFPEKFKNFILIKIIFFVLVNNFAINFHYFHSISTHFAVQNPAHPYSKRVKCLKTHFPRFLYYFLLKWVHY